MADPIEILRVMGSAAKAMNVAAMMGSKVRLMGVVAWMPRWSQ
jgi:hypothetical protein